MAKKKTTGHEDETSGGDSQSIQCLDNSEDGASKEEKRPPFRNPNFQHSTILGKKKSWRTLKPILAHDRSLPWNGDPSLYSTIVAPPRLTPPKKYSDISGSEAKYTDPQTKLFYANPEEFSTVRSLPSDIIAGYLALRGAINPIG